MAEFKGTFLWLVQTIREENMRSYTLIGIGLLLWLLIPGCGSNEETQIPDKQDSGSTGGSGPGSGGQAGADAGLEAEVESGVDAPEGIWECPTPNSERKIGYNMIYSCGLLRCIPGTGCMNRCDSADDCVTPEEIGWDPVDFEFYCLEGLADCFMRDFRDASPPY